MKRLRTMSLRHLIVAASVAAVVVAAALAVIGPAAPGPERITQMQVAMRGIGDGRLQVREVIDWDFGRSSRHGIERIIPTDLGTPTDVIVSSPDAPDQVQTIPGFDRVTYRIGDPSEKIRGRHRYVITYVLPNAEREVGRLAVDAVGTEWLVPIDDAWVDLVGVGLTSPGCHQGRYGTVGGCDLQPVDGGYQVHVQDLADHEGVTIEGDLVEGGLRSPATVDLPAIRPAPADDRPSAALWAVILGVLAAVSAAAVYKLSQWLGRNVVAAGGAADVAFGGGGAPSPLTAGTAPAPGVTTAEQPMLTDQELGELITIEFAPPAGVEPWQGAVVADEKIDDDTVGAWLSGLIARDVVKLVPDGDGELKRLVPGPKAAEVDPAVSAVLAQMFGGDQRVDLGSYSSGFARGWKQVKEMETQWAASRGMFRRRPPRPGGGARVVPLAIFGALFWFGGWSVVSALLAASGSVAGGLTGIAIAIAAPALVAFVVYGTLRTGLTAAGSAVALRTESFRRFLHESEAQHVEWAYSQGLLRQYSAWAVALGEADAWSRAMKASSVPPPEADPGGILYVPLLGPTIHSTTTPPSSSGGGGGFGGGFSGGGFSGGGGGGGGGGSW